MKKEDKLSPKVEALYKAVLELLLEGREVRKMKVSEITERAGIGKGTAYEYFTSREELILHALEYQKNVWTESLRERLSCRSSFMEKTECLFDMADTIVKNVNEAALEEICSIFFRSPMFERRDKHCLNEVLYDIVGEAKRGGELKETFPDEYIVLILFGKMFSYVSFCTDSGAGSSGTCTAGQVKGYLLDSIREEFTRKQ